jgi:hypothetical protein
VREWLGRRSAPSGVRAERVAELSSLVERLARVIRPAYIPVWLHKPVPALDDDKPIDASPRATTVRWRASSPASRTRAQSEVTLSVAAVTVKGRWIKHTYPGSPLLPQRDPPPDNRWQRGG